MKLCIGLGNPTKEYEKTRHNIGFMAVDYILESLGEDCKKEKFQSKYAKLNINNEAYLFVKPLTYMNNSGESIIKWVEFFDIAIEDIYVFYDDVDIPFGELRLKTGGSAGGHNGLKSMIAHLKTQDFHRIRLGIDRSEHGKMVDHVLGCFTKTQKQYLEEQTFPHALSFFNDLQKQPMQQMMNTYNQKKVK
ncbi:peptidyl-tRNA hydrolase [Erysipelotrichaceae bacterium]|nr:peptidyl-tRNA hydrolase [Erysipelotrichaceae bacterium]